MTNFIGITPFLPVADVSGAVRFFVDVLGFRAWFQAWDYAYVQREAVGVRIGKASEGPEERVEAGPRAFLFYIDVRDVAAVVEEVRPKLLAAGMAGGQGPVDQTWGQREFWVPVPEGGLIVFGEEIRRVTVTEPPMKGSRISVKSSTRPINLDRFNSRQDSRSSNQRPGAKGQKPLRTRVLSTALSP